SSEKLAPHVRRPPATTNTKVATTPKPTRSLSIVLRGSLTRSSSGEGRTSGLSGVIAVLLPCGGQLRPPPYARGHPLRRAEGHRSAGTVRRRVTRRREPTHPVRPTAPLRHGGGPGTSRRSPS